MSLKSNLEAVANLEPKLIWQLFAGMASVPRPSKKEQLIRQHIHKVVRERGLTSREDAFGNVLVEVPASQGCESAASTVIQGHLDMVCEKNSGVEFDFESDPIRLVADQDDSGEPIVRAQGTTLGADNGIGVCMALAAASNPDVVHGPLELLLTLDEEAGMSGAKSLKPGFFQGRRLLNLDSEADDVIYIGCAGGCDTTLTWEFATAPVEPGSDTCCISVSGLRGGHSGCDIHENRGSAICLMARTMAKYRLPNLRLVEIAAGSLRNALPREARLVINGPAGTISKLAESASVIQEAAVNETSEPNVRIEVSKADVPAAAISADDTSTLINALTALPHGVFDLHPVIDGLVQTSNNVATVASSPITNGHMRVTVATLSRSSSRTRMNVVLGQIAAVGRLAGASITTGNEYPGWDPNENSPLLKTCARLYEELFSHPANVTAIHAGLECGIIGERIGGMDMVSFGPRIEGAHSPDERIWVKSVQKSWKYLRAVLAELAKSRNIVQQWVRRRVQ